MAEEKDTENSEQKTEKSNCPHINGNMATPFDFGKDILCRIEKCPYGNNLSGEIIYEGEKARKCKIKGKVKENLLDKIKNPDIQTREGLIDILKEQNPDIQTREGLIDILKEQNPELKNLRNEDIEDKILPEDKEYEKLVIEYTDIINSLATKLWEEGARGQSPQISYPWEHEAKAATYGDLINHIRIDLDLYNLL